MRSLPQYLYQKDIVKLIDNLIMNDGYTSYAGVDDMAKESLSILCFNALGTDGYTAMIDTDDLDVVLRHLTRFIAFSTTDNAVCLADLMKRNAIRYFDQFLEELFAERFDTVACDRKLEAGLEPIVDPINGETRWVR